MIGPEETESEIKITEADQGLESMDEIQLKRDEMLYELLNVVDELKMFQSQAFKSLSNVYRQIMKGYLELAQAKYILGPGTFTQSQYDKNMKAIYILHHDDDKTMELIKEKDVKHDPIQWFSFLAPACLRKGQDHFRSSAKHLVQLANLIHQISVLERQCGVDLDAGDLKGLPETALNILQV